MIKEKYQKIGLKSFFSFLLLISQQSVAVCTKDDIIFKPFLVDYISKNNIINGKSVEMFSFESPNCDVKCYLDYVNSLKGNKVYAKSIGTIISLKDFRNNFISISVHKASKQGFSGQIICDSKKKNKPLFIPKLPILNKVQTDFQTTDAYSTNRTVSYLSVSKNVAINIAKYLKSRSKFYDITKGLSVFTLKDNMEVHMTYARTRGNVGSLVIVFIKKRELK